MTDTERDSPSLFDREQRVVANAAAMVDKLDLVSKGVHELARAYTQGLKEQQRLVRLSDRTQLDLREAQDRLLKQAEELRALNAKLSQEVDDRRRLEQELRVIADTDPLTSAFNRRHLFDRAAEELVGATRRQAPISLILADLDRFKEVNDRYGHEAGDRVLVHFVDLCRRCARQNDIIARIGGEEFVLLLPDTTEEAALRVAERVREALEAEPLVCDAGTTISLTVSIGVAGYHADEGIDRLIARADRALYEAKTAGRNRVLPASPNTQSAQADRAEA